MNHETALSKAREIADRVLAPAARQNDKEGRFSTEAVDALGRAGLLGLMLPTDFGGMGLGPRTFAAVAATLAEADASVAMVYMMHICAAATVAAARPGAIVAQVAGICPLSPSVSLARAVTSGRLSPARDGMAPACVLRRRSRG
jgi:hypothetical protein